MPSPASRPLSPTSAEHPANLARVIAAQAVARPGLRLGTTDDQLTLQEAVGFAARRARDLLDSGLRPGQRVAMVDSTSTDYLLTWLACLLAGTPVALVNPTYPADLIERMLAPLGPDRILGPDATAQARAGGKAAPDGLPGLDAGPFGVVSYMHTSGTTGLPKFCIQTHDYFRRMAAAMAAALDLTPNDRVLAPLPLFHINPMGYGIVTALLTGADALTVPRFSASRFWPSVVSEQVTVLILHAPPVEILKRATTGADAAGHRVRTMFYADAEFLRRFAIPAAVSGYGSTEAGGVSHLRRWPATEDIPADASRHGGPGPRRHRVAGRPGRHHLRTGTGARGAVRWLRHRRRRQLRPRRRRLVRHRRPRPRGRTGLPGLPRTPRRIDPGEGRVRSHPVRGEPPGRYPRDHRPRAMEAARCTG